VADQSKQNYDGEQMNDKCELYSRLTVDLVAVFEGERDLIANMANCAALLFHALPDLNWTGFYRTIDRDLVLGPFQGRPACIRIGPGRGVCGAAAARMSTVVVPDVNQFPGHIACDAASQAEIVVPLIVEGRVIGVLDLDSPIRNRFDDDDAAGLESVVAILLDASNAPRATQ
jgi:L-methionine (R)-S-oxide reductase